jgi:hypothetical protein
MNNEKIQFKYYLFYNCENDFNTLYYDKLSMLAIDKCLKLHKEQRESHSDHGQMELIDNRNKFVESCLNKVFDLHKIFDEEYLKNIN